jgi:hypothetical protein
MLPVPADGKRGGGGGEKDPNKTTAKKHSRPLSNIPFTFFSVLI